MNRKKMGKVELHSCLVFIPRFFYKVMKKIKGSGNQGPLKIKQQAFGTKSSVKSIIQCKWGLLEKVI